MSPERARAGAGRTALLLIDVQRHVLDAANHPPRPEFYRRARERVLPNLARLLGAARAADVEVIHTVIESLTRDGRDRGLDYKLSGFDIPRGAPGADIDPAVAPLDDEIVLPKSSACPFNSTPLAWLLRNLGVGELICAGFLTDQCVEQTVKHGCAEGFRVVCASDGCAANTDARHDAALERIAPFCERRDCDALIGSLTGRGRDEASRPGS